MIKLSVINDDLKNDKNYDGKIVNYSINDSYTLIYEIVQKLMI